MCEGSRSIRRVGEKGKRLQEGDGAAGVGRLYINDQCCFDAVPLDAWEYTVGAYQVCHKWLDDRRKAGRELSDVEVTHFRSIVGACMSLVSSSQAVEEVLTSLGGWEAVFGDGGANES